jgi:hypothetical protein
MGMTTQQLLDMNKGALLTIEEAGAGFAAAVALAEKYHGKEASSSQALMDIGASSGEEASPSSGNEDAKKLAAKVLETFSEQADGWSKRNLFERQWVVRDFRKNTGMSVEEMSAALRQLAEGSGSMETLRKLAGYYRHQEELLRGYEKDPAKVKKGAEAIASWIAEIDAALQAK